MITFIADIHWVLIVFNLFAQNDPFFKNNLGFLERNPTLSL